MPMDYDWHVRAWRVQCWAYWYGSDYARQRFPEFFLD
jgi:hypothetical protein